MRKLPANGLKGVACAAVIVVLSTASNACITPEEQKADQIRFLELQLKIAALRCRFENPKFTSLYNQFVKTHRTSIKASRWPVEAYLARQTRMDMDAYVTKTANQISLASMDVKGFCDNSAAVAKLAASSRDPLAIMDLLPVPYGARRTMCVDAGQESIVAEGDLNPAGTVHP